MSDNTVQESQAVPDGMRMLTKEQVAEAAAVSVKTVERLIAAGKLRAVHFSDNTVRILREDLVAYVQQKATHAHP